MSPDKTNTERIEIVSEQVKSLRIDHSEMDRRMRSLEVSHGQTIVYCKNIISSIEDFKRDTEKHRESVNSSLSCIEKAMTTQTVLSAVEDTQNKTRWELAGKPLAYILLGGGGVTAILKLLHL